MANDVEKSLDRVFEDITPDVLDRVFLRLDEREETGAAGAGDLFELSAARKKRPASAWRRRVAGVAAALLLIFGGTFIYGNRMVDSTVSLDVNPSIQLTVNRNEKILSVTPLNADAELILDNMDLRNVGLDVAVNALIGSMLKNGYLTELANSVLISVENHDAARAKALQERLSGAVGELLSAYTVDGSVISQSYTKREADIEALAAEYHISYSKAELICKLVALDPTLIFADMARLPVNDINLLLAAEPAEVEGVSSDGNASSAAYIAMDAAIDIALGHAGLASSEATVTKSKLDYDDGRMIYEVEFKNGGAEYEYEIDAVTGTVLDFEADIKDEGKHQPEKEQGRDHDDDDGAAVPAGGYIGTDAAKAIALSHAGLSDAEASFTKVELDDDDDGAVYELKFKSGSAAYKYEIDAVTGAVLKAKNEDD